MMLWLVVVWSPAAAACPSTCYGYNCDYWTSYDCSNLEDTHGCDCSGCSRCERTPRPTPRPGTMVSGLSAEIGDCLDSVTFHYADDSTTMFGQSGGGSVPRVDLDPTAEYVSGLVQYSGCAWYMDGGIEFIVKSIATGAATRTVSFAGSYQSSSVRAEFNVDWPCRIIGFETSPGDTDLSTRETVTSIQTDCTSAVAAEVTVQVRHDGESFSFVSCVDGAIVWNDRSYGIYSVPDVLHGARLYQGPHRLAYNEAIEISMPEGGRAFAAFTAGRDGGLPAGLRDDGWVDVEPQGLYWSGSGGQSGSIIEPLLSKSIEPGETYTSPKNTGSDTVMFVVTSCGEQGDGACAPTVAPAPTPDGCVLYVGGPIIASPSNQVATVDSLQNYELAFTMELASDWSITGEWQSILHIGDTDLERLPKIKFRPNDNALYVMQSYDDCSPNLCEWGLTTTGVTFAAGGTYEIKLQVESNQMTVYVDGVIVGTASGSVTYAAANAAVYVGDPWHDAAKVTLSDITLSEVALADVCRENVAGTTTITTDLVEQVVVEIKAAVVLTGIADDDFNSDPAAQQAFTQSILAHLPRELVDNGAQITDVVAESIPGECDEAPAYCSDVCKPFAYCETSPNAACGSYAASDCSKRCGSYAHCALRRRRLQTGGVGDVWSRVEVSHTIIVQQDETTVTDGGASVLTAVTSSLSSAVSTGAFLQTLIDEADAAGASATFDQVDVDVEATLSSLEEATVIGNIGPCEVCRARNMYDESNGVSCGGFTQKVKSKWGDWQWGHWEDYDGCHSNVCCANNKEDCCEANVGAITGLVVAIFVVFAMGCYRSLIKDSILLVWRRCCPKHKGTRGSAVQPLPPATVVGNSAVVAHLQLVTGASAEAARAALVAHVNDADAAAAALLAGWHPPAAIAATQNGTRGSAVYPVPPGTVVGNSAVVAQLQLVTGACEYDARVALVAHGNDADAAAAALLAAVPSRPPPSAAQPAPAGTIAEMMLRAENARVARMLTADDRAAEAERKLRAAEARAEARAAEAERKLRALEARAAEERRQRAAEEEAERQRGVRAATQISREARPSYWEPIMNRLNAEKFPVNPGSEEYARVEEAFMLTHDDPSRNLKRTQFTIQSIERIQNMDLWNLYVAKRKSICGRKSPKDAQNLVRNWLFHGCSGDVTDEIVQGGFNRSFCGKHGMMYGQGVYFARDASYSTFPLYSPPDTDDLQSIFLARVVVGEYCRGVRDALTPDVRDAATHAHYDSTVDNVRDPSIFVTYNDAQAYPEYLVKFKQDGNPPPPPNCKPAHPDYRPNVFSSCYD